MSQQKTAAYGSWHSPITADLIVAESVTLGQIVLDGSDIYWGETRPSENGRQAIVRWTPDKPVPTTMISPAFNARTRVHEYGGGDFTVQQGTLYFSNFADQRVYRLSSEGLVQPLTPASNGRLRYADFVLDNTRQRLICVREDHRGSGEAQNSLVTLPLNSANHEPEPLAEGTVLVQGDDFYSSPRLSPDGQQLAWLTWTHPNMPWDGTTLWLADFTATGELVNERHIAGGAAESIFQPEWSPEGILTFVSDRTDWWNLYQWRDGQIVPLCPMPAEFGRPQWTFNMNTYGFSDANTIVCSYTQQGVWHLARLDLASTTLTPIDLPFDDIGKRGNVRVGGSVVAFNAGSATIPGSIVCLNLNTQQWLVCGQSDSADIAPGYLSIPEPIAFPTTNGLTAHGFFYPPSNQAYQSPDEERPPLIVISHGGPTSAASTRFDLKIQYWTSRGFAVLDVNYGGSTGYGRSYRQRLNGQWGVVDVADCIQGARYLVAQGKVDPARLAIRGGSAGGYTTLCALTFHDDFRAGASHFGVSDVAALAQETHKFESRYMESLIGPYPQMAELYRQRSPIHFAEQINCPLILFQGLEDKVVPPNQAETMFAAVRAKGIPTAYVPFPGEQHGFRRAENIKRALDSELYFYSQVFGFPLATAVAPVEIHNLSHFSGASHK